MGFIVKHQKDNKRELCFDILLIKFRNWETETNKNQYKYYYFFIREIISYLSHGLIGSYPDIQAR